MKNLHLQLESLYLDWVNNFLSIQGFADHYGLEVDHAKELIALSKAIVLRGHTDHQVGGYDYVTHSNYSRA